MPQEILNSLVEGAPAAAAGSGFTLATWMTWAFWLGPKIRGNKADISEEEWEKVRKQAAKVPRLETHAKNMHKVLREIKGYIGRKEYSEANAAIMIAEALSDSHFTDASEFSEE